jgi:hypothetical protein
MLPASFPDCIKLRKAGLRDVWASRQDRLQVLCHKKTAGSGRDDSRLSLYLAWRTAAVRQSLRRLGHGCWLAMQPRSEERLGTEECLGTATRGPSCGRFTFERPQSLLHAMHALLWEVALDSQRGVMCLTLIRAR